MPLSDLIQPSTEDYIKNFQDANPGSSEDAFKAAMLRRQQADQGKSGAQRDLNLRDAEHALFVQSQVDQKPIIGRLQALAAVPFYSAAKVASQNYGIAPATIKSLTGADASSTKPDLRELLWGLRPVFKSLRPGASSQPAGRGPDPEQP